MIKIWWIRFHIIQAKRNETSNIYIQLFLQRVQIKLSGGRTDLDGRLEVLPPGQDDWGVICGDNWSLKEAIVACRHFDKGYAMQAAKVHMFLISDGIWKIFFFQLNLFIY